MRFQARRLASQACLRETLQTNRGVHRGLQNQPCVFVRIPAKKWFRHLVEAGRSYHFVNVLKLNNWQLRALGFAACHGDNFEAAATSVLPCECTKGKQFGLMQQLNRGVDWLLEDKRGAARHCSHSLASILLTAPMPNSQGKSYTLLLTICRQEARNRNLGMLRPGQATNVFPS